MKKISIFVLSAMVLLGIFISCSKNSNPTPEPITNGHTYTADEMALWNKLNNFNQKVKFGLKSEEFISPDSAMWYLEALFNVKQATDTTFDDVVTYKKSYTLDVNPNGTVNMSKVVEVYTQLVADLQAELEGIDSDYKFLIIADLQKSDLKSGDFEIELTGGLGVNLLNFYQPITTVDNWYYGNMLGRCDGQYLWQSDAGRELARRFNNPGYDLPFEYNFWINVDVTDPLSHDDYPNRIFYQEATSAPCIPYTNMQHYLTQGHYIIYNGLEDVPSGEFITGKYFKVMDLWTNDEPPIDGKYWHKYTIYYGTPVYIPPVE